MARANGWRGTNAKKGVTFDQALTAGKQALDARERQTYIDKIETAAAATRDMGLVIPG